MKNKFRINLSIYTNNIANSPQFNIPLKVQIGASRRKHRFLTVELRFAITSELSPLLVATEIVHVTFNFQYSSPSILQPSILRPPLIIRPFDLVPKHAKGNILC